MNKRQRDKLITELFEAVDLLDEAYDAGRDPGDELEALTPIIWDAVARPEGFQREVERAIDEQDQQWLDELMGTLNEQIKAADDDQLLEYYEHFAPAEEE
jgi:hypothetical protein